MVPCKNETMIKLRMLNNPWRDDMLVVEKYLPSKKKSSTGFIILCLVAIGLVIRANKDYIQDMFENTQV